MARFYYGGQAVIEGVMMRGRRTVAMAMRLPDGTMTIHEEPLNPKVYQNRLFRLPFLRGVLMLWEMLVLGTRLLTLSANVSAAASTPDDEQKDDPSTADQATATPEQPAEQPPAIGGWTLALTLFLSLGFAVAIFFVTPLLVTSLLHQWIGSGWLNLTVEGIIRLALLVGYLLLIGRLEDIQRVFGYHGAEHMAVNALEQGQPLDVEHVRQASRVHTRCGTGFLLLVMVVSIFVFAAVGEASLLVKILSRVLLIPVIAAVAYELMRLGAAYYRFTIVRWLLTPGLALQKLTTRVPDDSMIECAIAALQRVVEHDEVALATKDDHKERPDDVSSLAVSS